MEKELMQGSPEWLRMRKSFIGGSDAPIIMRVNKKYSGQDKKTPYTLWKEKLGLETKIYDSESIRYGKDMEPHARSLYEEMTGDLVAPEVIFHKEIKYMMASLDGLNMTQDLAVEIKCANKEDHELAKEGKVPNHYFPQLQHQMACLNHDRIHYFSFHKGDGLIVEVKRNDGYLNTLYEEEEKFWKCVLDLTEPSLTDDDYIERDQEWITLADGLFYLKKKIKQLQSDAKEYENQLKRLSDNRNSRGGSYSYTQSTSKGTIDYSSIPELNEVDLDIYRKDPIIRWNLKKIGD